MKLRIRGSSLRLRLTRAEVDALAQEGRVEDAIAFGPDASARLVYAIVARETSSVTAEWTGRTISVVLPVALARDWAESERVGIEHVEPVGPGQALRILIEKDFACLTPRQGEDDENAFPNPNSSC